MNQVRVKDKKLLGAYYTPKSVTDSLCTWAVRSKTDNILEPSFGGCGFLLSLHKRLEDLGCKEPITQLYGCDIDINAFNVLNRVFDKGIQGNFIHNDFLFTKTSDFDDKTFPVIVGNPPYLSLNAIKENKLSYWDILKNHNISFKKRASLWSYFVIHSLSFLQVGGRMAWVLPHSLLFTDYGKQIQNIIADSFSKVDIVKINQRFFIAEGTDEKTLFLLCEGYKQGKCKIEIHSYENLSDGLNDINSSMGFQSVIEKQLNPSLFSSVETLYLKDICDIRIGIVVGASKHLIYTHQDLSTFNLSSNYYYPVFCRAGHAKGIVLKKEILLNLEHKRKTFLIDFESLLVNDTGLFQVIYNTIPKSIFINNVTFNNRPNWFGYNDYKIPDAFLVYFNSKGPRIILNPDGLNSTNNIHRIYFKDKFKNKILQKLVAISTITSVTRYQAELIGRSYGAGVLKLEPSDAKKMMLYIPKHYTEEDVDNTFEIINYQLEIDNVQKAIEIADAFIFKNLIVKDLEGIRTGLFNMQKSRYITNPL